MAQSPRSESTLDEHYPHESEIARQRREWEEARKAEKEEQERARKQAELQSFLQRRSAEWEAHVGCAPPADVVYRWQHEYVRSVEIAASAARQQKIDEAIRNSAI